MSEMDSKGAKQRRKRRAYTDEFKAGAVRLVLVEGRTVSEVAKDVDLTRSALDGWLARTRADAGHAKPGAITTRQRDALTRLRRENRQLKMEGDILKEAEAFFAKESR